MAKEYYRIIIYDDEKYHHEKGDEILGSMTYDNSYANLVDFMKDAANFCDCHGIMGRASKVELVIEKYENDEYVKREVIGEMKFNNEFMCKNPPNPNIIKSLAIKGFENISLERLPYINKTENIISDETTDDNSNINCDPRIGKPVLLSGEFDVLQ